MTIKMNVNVKKQQPPTKVIKTIVPPKNKIIPQIPLNIYTCWHTKQLPPKMKENFEYLQRCNPEFKVHLYDNNDCEKFIAEHFEPDVLYAYKSLIPQAYKSDLWRYCIMYINGGIYLDIKFRPVNNFKFIYLTQTDNLVCDIDVSRIYNALLIFKPKNEALMSVIKHIVENVKNRYYGSSDLDITGPKLLSKYFSGIENSRLKLIIENITKDTICHIIIYKNIHILKMYDEYRLEQKLNNENQHYSLLWLKKNIYNNI